MQELRREIADLSMGLSISGPILHEGVTRKHQESEHYRAAEGCWPGSQNGDSES
jgi:hypothetical protein